MKKKKLVAAACCMYVVGWLPLLTPVGMASMKIQLNRKTVNPRLGRQA